MTTEPRDSDPFRWLVRVVGVLVLLPVRLLVQVVVRIGDLLLRWVGRPISWAVAVIRGRAERDR